MEGHLSSFRLLAVIIDKAATNIHIEVFVFLNTSFHSAGINAQECSVLGLMETAYLVLPKTGKFLPQFVFFTLMCSGQRMS